MLVLAYLGLLALVPLLTEKDDKEVQWHAKHGLVQFFAWIVIFVLFSILSFIPGVGCVTSIISLFLWIPYADRDDPVDHEGGQRPALHHPGPLRLRGQVLR